jgi:hypothetical protein
VEHPKMNTTKRIGRYMLPILSVVAIKQRSGLRACLKKGYDVILYNGHRIHFTEEEKQQYEQAIKKHNQVKMLFGMCLSSGLKA